MRAQSYWISTVHVYTAIILLLKLYICQIRIYMGASSVLYLYAGRADFWRWIKALHTNAPIRIVTSTKICHKHEIYYFLENNEAAAATALHVDCKMCVQHFIGGSAAGIIDEYVYMTHS